MPWWNYEIMDVMVSYTVNMIMINEFVLMITIILWWKQWIKKTTTLLQTYVVTKIIIKYTINHFYNNDNGEKSDNNN